MFEQLVSQCDAAAIILFCIRDGRESFVVTKVFDVENLESDVTTADNDDLSFICEIPVAEV